jgi:translation initiation factor IF-3
MDLIEVSDKVDPPAVKIGDLRKFLYEQSRKGATKIKKSIVKEMRMSPGIGENDLGIKLKKVREFLEEGHQVKLTVQFRGRENAHPEIGMDKLKKAIATIADIGKTEGSPKKMGSFLSVIVVPK